MVGGGFVVSKGEDQTLEDLMKCRRIGPKMEAAVAYVAAHPDCAILPVAEHVGPHGSRAYGYRTVHRAIKAGLLKAERLSSGAYRLTVA